MTTVIRQTLVFFAVFMALASARALAADLPRFTGEIEELRPYMAADRWLVVKLWASDCIICNREAQQYVDFHEFNAEHRAAILGISLDGDNQAAAHGFIGKHGIPYPNLIAGYQAAGRWYEQMSGHPFRGTPSFLLFDPSGTLRAQQVGAVPTELIEQFIDANSTGLPK